MKPKRTYAPRSYVADEQRLSIDAADRAFTAVMIAFEPAAYRRALKKLVAQKSQDSEKE